MILLFCVGGEGAVGVTPPGLLVEILNLEYIQHLPLTEVKRKYAAKILRISPSQLF